MGFDDDGESGREVISGGVTGSSCGSALDVISSVNSLGKFEVNRRMQQGPPRGLYEPLAMEMSAVIRRHNGVATSGQWLLKICLAIPWGELGESNVVIYPTLDHLQHLGSRIFPFQGLAPRSAERSNPHLAPQCAHSLSRSLISLQFQQLHETTSVLVALHD